MKKEAPTLLDSIGIDPKRKLRARKVHVVGDGIVVRESTIQTRGEYGWIVVVRRPLNGKRGSGAETVRRPSTFQEVQTELGGVSSI